MPHYEVTGIPISPPFDELTGRRVGDRFEATIDPDVERLLIGGGALRVVEAPPAPEPEPAIERVPAKRPTR